MTSTSAPSEASGPAAGYYYQLRYALLRAVQALKKNPTAAISIERLEDVAIEYESGKSDLEQLKHSLQTDKEYSNADVAVWRTLGNWSRLFASGANIIGARFFLVTNGKFAVGSALQALGPDRDKNDEQSALAQLIGAASGSSNQTTKGDRQDFLELAPPVRGAMIRAITAVEGLAGLSGLGDEIESEIGFVCTHEELPRFRNELEGWWVDKVFREWANGTGATVQLLDLGARIDYLREIYKESTLTIDVEDEEALEPLEGRLFVRQIKALNAGSDRLRRAQKDFLKSGAQRSKWIREFKVNPNELAAYDHSLAERWERKSAILKDELNVTADEIEKCKWGRNLLGWAEEQEVPIRSARAQFLTSGSYHALADQLRIGWHPDYEEIFKDG